MPPADDLYPLGEPADPILKPDEPKTCRRCGKPAAGPWRGPEGAEMEFFCEKCLILLELGKVGWPPEAAENA